MKQYLGYIYCIISPTNRIYVGQKRSTKVINDYWGSPSENNDLNKEYKLLAKQGIFPNNYELYGYKREILEWCETQEELNKQERYWIKEKHAHITQGGYNRSWGLGENSTFSGWSAGLCWYNNGEKEICAKECPEGYVLGRLKQTFVKQSNSLKERYEKDENLKDQTGRKNKGRKHSEKSKENIRNSLIKRWKDPKSQILKENLSNRCKGKSPANKGLHWYNNGFKNIQAKECPEGCVKGVLRRNFKPWNKGKKMSKEWKANHPTQSTKGYKWYNNGKKELLSKKYPGEGWFNGKIKKIKEKNNKNKTVLYSKEWREKVSQSLQNKKPNNGKKWWNDGVKEVFQFKCPEGYVKGRLKRSNTK